jgi:O-antigen/teichoic acid export membrane protein
VTLNKQAAQAIIWIVIGYGLSQSIRLTNNLILTRLLIPELFGLMALIQAFIIGLTMFSDIGLGPSIIQNKRSEDSTFLNTIWTMQLIRGVILWVVCLLITWPISIFYQDVRILWVLPITSLSMMIAGLNSTAIFTLNKNLCLGKLISLELVSQFFSTAVMIFWAWVSPSVCALITGNLLASVLQVLWSHRLIPNFRNRLCWDRMAVKEVFSFGKWVFFSTAMTFLSAQADNLILAKIFSLELLGVYIVASAFANIPRHIVGQLSIKLIYPIMSAHIHLHRPILRKKVLAKRYLVLLLIAPCFTILIGFGDLIILKLYDERYASGSWMLPILAMGLWPRVLAYTIDPVFLALGKPKYIAYGNLLVFIVLAVGVPIAFYLSGIIYVIILIASKEAFSYTIIYYGLMKEKMAAAMQDIISTAFLFILVVLIFTARGFFDLGGLFDFLPNRYTDNISLAHQSTIEGI